MNGQLALDLATDLGYVVNERYPGVFRITSDPGTNAERHDYLMLSVRPDTADSFVLHQSGKSGAHITGNRAIEILTKGQLK